MPPRLDQKPDSEKFADDYAWEEFVEWAESQESDVGDDPEDWEIWWRCFHDGYQAARSRHDDSFYD